MRSVSFSLAVAVPLCWSFVGAVSFSQDVPAELVKEADAIQTMSQGLAEAYNSGKADELIARFLPEAELVDDEGNVYRGREEIAGIYGKFVEQFPGAKMELAIEGVHFPAAELAIEHGLRSVTTSDGEQSATNRYSVTYVKRDGQWMVASAREEAADPLPTAGEFLQPLAWLVGDWVDEGTEASIAISCRWADSGNFLLLDFSAVKDGEVIMKTEQRIGWDPLVQSVRSWSFDSDGGFGEAHWTELEDRWLMKSSAVMPDGQAGSATITIQPVDGDRFVMAGFDRIAGGAMVPDFEAVIVRRPPAPTE